MEILAKTVGFWRKNFILFQSGNVGWESCKEIFKKIDFQTSLFVATKCLLKLGPPNNLFEPKKHLFN